MPEGGTLTLRTRESARRPTRRGPRIAVEVCDTGMGMDEDTRRRCLEPFFTTKGERGTGLGLAMVYGIVQRHGARSKSKARRARARPSDCIFQSGAATAPAGKSPGDLAVPARQRVLVVDDDPLLLRSLRDILERDGHMVVCAKGGQEGIDKFCAARNTQHPFAAVITDLGMPYVDGRKVAAAIKAASATTPVILLTGWGRRLVAEGDAPPHVDRVLAKPPKLAELREALSQLSLARGAG